jgi:hypothetical protein
MNWTFKTDRQRKISKLKKLSADHHQAELTKLNQGLTKDCFIHQPDDDFSGGSESNLS